MKKVKYMNMEKTKIELDKEKFLKTDLGIEIKTCIKLWDYYLNESRKSKTFDSKEINEYYCKMYAQEWNAYKMTIKHFFGIEYSFSRTDEYFGLVTNDKKDWLFKIEREI